MNHPPDSDELMVFRDADAEASEVAARHWKVLVVDDDRDVHTATEMAFQDIAILGRPLLFSHAYSASEALALISSSVDLAVILLDVVMEEEDSGLRLVRNIRSDLGMSEVRIILRTGQPGYAPEIETIRDLDINDYKTKTELNRVRLYATITAAIRSYDQIARLNAGRHGLDLIVRGSAELIRLRGLRDFASGVIMQLAALLGIAPEGVVCAQEFNDDDGDPQYRVLAGAGRYADCINLPLDQLGAARIAAYLREAMQARKSELTADHATLYIGGGSTALAVYLETPQLPGEVDLQLIEVFCGNMAVCVENIDLFQRLGRHAYFDNMVQLPNRAHFLREVDAWLNAPRQERRLIVLVDVDNFAEINDALGHRYGDALLQAIALRLRSSFEPATLIARLGGDVFGLFGEVQALAPQAVLALFVKPFEVLGETQSVSVTLGLARLEDLDGGADDAFKSASIALKRAQGDSRGGYSYFSRALGEQTRERVNLLGRLRAAFDAHELFLHYQPQVSLQTGRAVGLEALLRWRTATGEMVPPSAFVPLAERSGLIVALGDWVLRTACLQGRALHLAGHAELRMAVNVSVLQFKNPNFLQQLDTALASSGMDARLLELEITESIAMLDAEFIIDMLAQIKARGVQLAIDDFGTGFSSLSYLHRLDIERLKIDRAFVSQLGQRDHPQSIAGLVTALGRSLGLEVLAEGVETVDQARWLRANDCQEAQGFLFAKPMAEAELPDWLARHADGRLFQRLLD